MCAAHGWATLRLDGSCSVKQRQGLVDRFNDANDPSFCFLVRRLFCPPAFQEPELSSLPAQVTKTLFIA
jgi:hypothetical protein